jgi:hypothetical protein
MVRSLSALLLLLASAAHAAANPVRIDVPRATKPPVVDGRVGSAEWTKAARVPLMDGGHALLLHNGTYLYVAIVARRVGIGSLCTMRKDQVRVLHASAGIGSALFDKKDGGWQLTQGFTFSNSTPQPGNLTNSGPAAAPVSAANERKQYLAKEGWFANSSPTGQLQREFQVRVDGRTEIPLVISFMSWVTREEFDLDVWPDAVVDGCAELDLAGGWTNRSYTFEPATWGIAALQ